MANEFVIKNGFESKDNSAVTGSLIVGPLTSISSTSTTFTSSQVISTAEGFSTTGRSIGIHARGITNDAGPVNFGDPPLVLIGGRFSTANDGEIGGSSYSLWLQDGTEAAGKVLVSQTADGLANWSTRLSGSYEVTGSFKVTPDSTIAGSVLDTSIYELSYPSGSGYQSTLDWQNHQLTHFSTGSNTTTPTIDWNLGNLRRDTGAFSRISLNWFDQTLRYGASGVALDWSGGNSGGYVVSIRGNTEIQDGTHTLTGSLAIS